MVINWLREKWVGVSLPAAFVKEIRGSDRERHERIQALLNSGLPKAALESMQANLPLQVHDPSGCAIHFKDDPQL